MKVITDFVRVIRVLARVSRGIDYNRAIVCIIILAGIIGGISNTALIAIINMVLNNAPRTPGLVWSFVILCLVLAFNRFISAVLLTRLTQRAIFDLRMQLCDQILASPLRQLEQLGSHRLLAILTSDVPSLTNALVMLPLLCMNLTILLCCLGYMGWLSWPLLLGVIGLMVLGIVLHQLPVAKAVQHFIRAREEMDSLFKYIRALIEGVKELKLHRRRSEAFFSKLLRPAAVAMQKENIRGETIWAAAGNWGHLMLFISIGTVIFVVPAITATDTSTLTGYTFAILYLMGPLEYVLNTVPQLGRADASMKKIEALSGSLTYSSQNEPPAAPAEIKPSWNLLELKGISHSYEREGADTSFALGPIDLCFRPGEMVFVTGGNGCGKTTLAKLLIGLYAPEAGEIRLDGGLIGDENRDSFRQYFSVVFSDFHLFEDLLGLEELNIDVKAQEYLTRLQLERKVEVKDGKLSTLDLSQGQRKRLALLTAYLEDRPIYVFDEWAADQDPHFKAIFYHQLLPNLVAKGKTVIAITHDDRYYPLAKRIIKLDEGKLQFDKSTNLPEDAQMEPPSPLNNPLSSAYTVVSNP